MFIKIKDAIYYKSVNVKSNSFRINFEPNKKLILQIRAKRLNIKDPDWPEAVSL